jgi:murein DD-endopeptidase MepM/ murein hydrolase activator NlpD
MIFDLYTPVSEIAVTFMRGGAWQVWFATILFGIVFGLIRLLRIKSPRVRHALWGLVFVRLLLPPDFSLPFGIGNLVNHRLGSRAEEFRIHFMPQLGDRMVQDGITPSVLVDNAGDQTPWAQRSAIAVLLLWLTGSLVVGTVWLHRRRQCHRILLRAEPVGDPALEALLHDWRKRLGIRRPIRLLVSPSIRFPFTLGSVRPAIVLPTSVVEFASVEVVEAVLAHEVVHVKRWDDLLLQLETAISTLYFFFPIVWVTAKRMRDEREHICDEMVLSHARIAPGTYRRGILTVLRLGLEGGHVHAPAFASARARLEARLQAVTTNSPSRKPKITLMLAATILLGLFLLPMSPEAVEPSQLVSPEGTSVQDTLILENPLPGASITSGFGVRFNPILQAADHHDGIDVRTDGNPPAAAAADGLVEVATTSYNENEGYGTVVILDHGRGFKTVYAHLDSLMVRKGHRVTSGQTVGIVGSTGVSTGPHLHFEVWRDGEPLDPARFVVEWR